jgi:hypothetical protein
MSEEERLFGSFTPKFDRKRESMDRLAMTTDKRSAEVYSLKVVLFGLEVGDLADVVTMGSLVKNKSLSLAPRNLPHSVEKTP